MNLTLLRQPLGQLLLGRGAVAPAQLETALAEQRRAPGKKLLGEILVESRLCSQAQVAEALAESYGVPFARLSPRLADPKVLSVLPRSFLEREQVVPLFLVEGVLTVAVVEPANVFLLDEIRRLTGHKVQPVAAIAADVEATLRASRRGGYAAGAVEDGGGADCEAAPDSLEVVARPGAAAPVGGNQPAVRLARACLHAAINASATDVHLEPGEGRARVRYRIDGRLVERTRPSAQAHAAVVALLKAWADADAVPHATRGTVEGTIRVRLDGRALDLRLVAAPVGHGEKVVIRIGDGGRPPMRLEKLGFGYETLKQWRRLVAASRGLLLVTGPAGSGKRTTLCSTLAEVDAAGLNVCAVGAALDRPLTGVTQFGGDDGAGDGAGAGAAPPAAALRAALAQDPDVLMLPEASDPESARLAAAAAMAGPLVLSAVHAADAVGAISRLLSVGIEPFVVGSAISGVLAQRLVRRLCSKCREAYEPTATERKQLERSAGAVPILYRPKGCNHCRGTGFAGRIGLFELIVPGDELIDAICRGGARAELVSRMQQPPSNGLLADGAEKAKAGMTTLQELLSAVRTA